MKLGIPKDITALKQHLKTPLYKNSVFIMLTSVTGAEFGFVFWLLAAKLYQPEDVGFGTALISSMALLVLLTRFGLDFSIIRFFPGNDKSRVFSTAALITSFFALLFGLVFILGIDLFSPELHLLRVPRNALLFLVFLTASSVAALTGISFVAVRRAEFYFLQSILVGFRVLFIIPLVFLGALGIFGAVGISFILAILVSLVLLTKLGIRPAFKIDTRFLQNAFRFSAGNYLAGLFITAPNSIVPLMVLNLIGAEETAYYYIAFAIASLLFMIPGAVSTSLFVEGSHGEALKRTTLKALRAIFSLLIPSMLFLFFAKWSRTVLIGADYSAHGLELLRIMVLASLFVAVTSIYYSINRIQKDVKRLVALSGLIFALLIGLSYLFMLHAGIIGVGYAWLASYGIGAVLVGLLVKREGWL
ncbi:MAG: polymerase [Methanophagales archaeon ANME-1-THS]|nr:MAG: polymerase [Methanophagales archaeon ANME-1-THS]